MGATIKTFDASGIAPGGRLFAGDLNSIQAAKADSSDFGQTIDLGTLRLGDSGISFVKYGPGEVRLTAMFRTDGILRGLGGIIAGAFTTTQRNAIASGLAPYGIVILNTTTNQYEWNKGTDAARNWQPFGLVSVGTADIVDDSITLAKMANDSVGAAEIIAGAVGTSELAPGAVDTSQLANGSVTAAKLAAAIAYLGTPVTAVDAGTKTTGSTYTITAPVAGTYIIEWGASSYTAPGQGNSAQLTCSKGGATVIYGDVGPSGGTGLVIAALTASEVVTITLAGAGTPVFGCWAKLTRVA